MTNLHWNSHSIATNLYQQLKGKRDKLVVGSNLGDVRYPNLSGIWDDYNKRLSYYHLLLYMIDRIRYPYADSAGIRKEPALDIHEIRLLPFFNRYLPPRSRCSWCTYRQTLRHLKLCAGANIIAAYYHILGTSFRTLLAKHWSRASRVTSFNWGVWETPARRESNRTRGIRTRRSRHAD